MCLRQYSTYFREGAPRPHERKPQSRGRKAVDMICYGRESMESRADRKWSRSVWEFDAEMFHDRWNWLGPTVNTLLCIEKLPASSGWPWPPCLPSVATLVPSVPLHSSRLLGNLSKGFSGIDWYILLNQALQNKDLNFGELFTPESAPELYLQLNCLTRRYKSHAQQAHALQSWHCDGKFSFLRMYGACGSRRGLV